MPMAMADELVSDALLDQVLEPGHLSALLGDLRKETKTAKDDTAVRKQALTRDLRRIKGEVDNLLGLVAAGTMTADDPSLREQLSRRNAQRDEVERQMAMLGRRLDIPTGWAGPRKVEAFAKGLRDLWTSGDVRFRQAYLRLLVDKAEIKGDEIRISGSKSVLAAAIAHGASASPEQVRSFAREWRAGGDESGHS
jgi:hypothetical protein